MTGGPALDAARDDRFAHLAKRHPCFSSEAHGRAGRLHLPVSPSCNIRCRFCTRGLSATALRPGIARQVVGPHEAVELVEKSLALCPELAVVGVAGPGDALATDHALEALARVHGAHPELLTCLSTNGLRLAERVDELLEAGVATVTVTVNSLDPVAQARLCRAVFLRSPGESCERLISGEAGARLLIAAQLAGIAAAAAAGIIVKINTVLVPGVNDGGIAMIAERAAAAGASLMNVIPLIPGLGAADLRVPTCDELKAARAAAERHLPVFRHCRQCRADALGVPGRTDDLGARLFGEPGGPPGRDLTFSHG
jgi:nitrogen fixation protein NifB